MQDAVLSVIGQLAKAPLPSCVCQPLWPTAIAQPTSGHHILLQCSVYASGLAALQSEAKRLKQCLQAGVSSSGRS